LLAELQVVKPADIAHVDYSPWNADAAGTKGKKVRGPPRCEFRTYPCVWEWVVLVCIQKRWAHSSLVSSEAWCCSMEYGQRALSLPFPPSMHTWSLYRTRPCLLQAPLAHIHGIEIRCYMKVTSPGSVCNFTSGGCNVQALEAVNLLEGSFAAGAASVP
jgi:hypothetical protein